MPRTKGRPALGTSITIFSSLDTDPIGNMRRDAGTWAAWDAFRVELRRVVDAANAQCPALRLEVSGG